MPARQVCRNFFRDALAPFHKYRQNALLDATIALINRASLTLTSIGRFLPGTAQVKNKRVDRLLGNESLHRDIPLIFKNIIANRLKNDYSRSPDMWQRSIAGCYQNNVAWLYLDADESVISVRYCR